jgi:hypothetical protein
LISCLVRAQAAAASLALPTPLVCLSPSLCLYPFMWCSRAPSVPTHWKAKYRNLAIFTTFFWPRFKITFNFEILIVFSWIFFCQ